MFQSHDFNFSIKQNSYSIIIFKNDTKNKIKLNDTSALVLHSEEGVLNVGVLFYLRVASNWKENWTQKLTFYLFNI